MKKQKCMTRTDWNKVARVLFDSLCKEGEKRVRGFSPLSACPETCKIFDEAVENDKPHNPKENEIHQCDVLKMEGRCLDYVCKNTGKARWRLIHAVHGRLEDDENQVVMQVVLFCPGCGVDLRKDTAADYAGKPYKNQVLEEAGCKRS